MLESNVNKRKLAKKEARKNTLIHRKVSTYKHKGYAFSGDKGHDTLVTDRLGVRI